jgi:hypothetical protein
VLKNDSLVSSVLSCLLILITADTFFTYLYSSILQIVCDIFVTILFEMFLLNWFQKPCS